MTEQPTEDGTAALHAALAKAQAAFPPIAKTKEVKVKTKTGGQYSFMYSPLDDILDAVRSALSENGLAITQLLDELDGKPALRTTVMHQDGGSLSGTFPLAVTGGMSPQELGSLITYVRRYALVAALGIATEEDADAGTGASAGNGGDFSAESKGASPAPATWREINAEVESYGGSEAWSQVVKAASLAKFGSPDSAQLTGEQHEELRRLGGVALVSLRKAPDDQRGDLAAIRAAWEVALGVPELDVDAVPA